MGNERKQVLLNRWEFVVALREGVNQGFVVRIGGAVLHFEDVAKVLNCFVYRQEFSVVSWRTCSGGGCRFIGEAGRSRCHFSS